MYRTQSPENYEVLQYVACRYMEISREPLSAAGQTTTTSVDGYHRGSVRRYHGVGDREHAIVHAHAQVFGLRDQYKYVSSALQRGTEGGQGE